MASSPTNPYIDSMDRLGGNFRWDDNTITKSLRVAMQDIDEYDFPFPKFANNKFMPKNADDTMMRTLGVTTICSVAIGMNQDPNEYPMIEFCRKLRDDYVKMADIGHHYDYVKTMTHRPIITEDQFFNEVIGITIYPNGIYPADRYFNETRQNAILIYAKNIADRPGG